MPRDYRRSPARFPDPPSLSVPPPAMTSGQVAALARALATLCAEGDGDWRANRYSLYGELRARLPHDHPARADEQTATAAAHAVRDVLSEEYGCHFLSNNHNRWVRIRLNSTAR